MTRTFLLSLGFPAAAATTVVPVAAATGDTTATIVFAIAASLLLGIAGAAHRWLPRLPDVSTPIRLAVVAGSWSLVSGTASTLTWLAVSLSDDKAGAVALADPWSAIFETVSGFSTTGLSMLSDPSVVAPWLQWWRSIMQWFGAIGVVAFAMTVAEPSGDHDTLVDSEWGRQPGGNVGETARRLLGVLGGLTMLSVVALTAVGEPAWQAINHGMTAAATGGFTITANGAAGASGAARAVIALTLLVAAVSFGTIYDRVRRRGVPLWRRTQVRYSVGSMTISCVLALVVTSGVAFQDVVFNSVSASTTGGFSSGTSYRTVEAVGAITMVSMFIGGAAGSTSGGIKSARLAWLLKAASRWLPGRAELDGDRTYEWDAEQVDATTARFRVIGAASLVVTWLMLVAIATVTLAAHEPGRPASDALFEAFSAASGVGLSSGMTGVGADAATKATLSLLMLAGRVEMTAFVVLLVSPLDKLRRRAVEGGRQSFRHRAT